MSHTSAMFCGFAKQAAWPVSCIERVFPFFLSDPLRPDCRRGQRSVAALNNHSAFCAGGIKAPLSESQINVIGQRYLLCTCLQFWLRCFCVCTLIHSVRASEVVAALIQSLVESCNAPTRLFTFTHVNAVMCVFNQYWLQAGSRKYPRWGRELLVAGNEG